MDDYDYNNYDDDDDDSDTQWLQWWGSLIMMNKENASNVSKIDTSWYLLQKMTFLEKYMCSHNSAFH